MATAAVRDKRILAARNLIGREQARRDKAQGVVDEANAKIESAKARIEWLEKMPVDDEPVAQESADEDTVDDSGYIDEPDDDTSVDPEP